MKKFIALLLATLMILSCVGCAQKDITPEQPDTAQSETPVEEVAWTPTKPITLIVSFAAGGGADVACRLLASYVEKELGQTIVIQNVAGDGGSIGLQQMIDAKPDGYTLAYISSSKTNNNLTLDGVTATIEDYTPVVKFASDPHLIISSKSSGITTFNEMIEKVKNNPDSITFGLGGAWGSHEYLRIGLEDQFGIKFKRMVYSSGNLAAGGVASGDCMVSTPFYSEVAAHIDAGNVNVLAVTSRERLEALPDVPTVAELSGTDFSWYMWRGIVGPAGMDEAILKTFSDAFEKACMNEEYQAKALDVGVYTDFQNYEDFAEFFYADHEYYKQLIESQNF